MWKNDNGKTNVETAPDTMDILRHVRGYQRSIHDKKRMGQSASVFLVASDPQNE